MLPAPNSNRPRPSSFPSVSYFVRRIQNNRQLALVLGIILLIIFYKTAFAKSSPSELDYERLALANSLPHLNAAKDSLVGGNKFSGGSDRLGEKELEALLSLEKAKKGRKHLDDAKGLKRSPCPDYTHYSSAIHPPLSKGSLSLPFQRPVQECRTFSSNSVEKVIDDMNGLITDPDLARLFENTFPNTLDTTVRWHHNGSDPQSFIVTGDINALWLRDAHKQVQIYSPLAKSDPAIQKLILGLINTQSDYVLSHPYCNAFQPPPQSGIAFNYNAENDAIFPRVNLNIVFECKYEIDSLASFLAIGNVYYKDTGDSSFVTPSWLNALSRLLRVLTEQAIPTYSTSGHKLPNYYLFRRNTNTGTETLNLEGAGNPVNGNTSLIRSAFRPSDDATIYQFFIPGNAFMSVELRRTATLLEKLNHNNLAAQLRTLGEDISRGIYQHGTYNHPVFGKVFAYEVDGFGSVSIMDDANTPSLLSLPDMGFVEANDETYLNTRRMILSKEGNPYYLKGQFFEGIGGPHIGTRFAWPMSHLVAMRTTDDDDEIARRLNLVKGSTAGLGLMHESVNVDLPHSFTRSWFAWCNSEFAKTILDLAERKPHLLFGKNASPYIIGGGSTSKGTANEAGELPESVEGDAPIPPKVKKDVISQDATDTPAVEETKEAGEADATATK